MTSRGNAAVRAVAALGVALGLTIAACDSQSGAAEPAASGPDAAAATDRGAIFDQHILDQVEWIVDEGGRPALRFDPPLGVTGPAARVVSNGDGAIINVLDSVTFEYQMFRGDTGALEYSTYESGRPQTIVLTPDTMSRTFADALTGQRVGAEILVAVPDTSGNTVSDYLVTMFMAVTVIDAHPIPTRAQGKPVPAVPGLPKVTLDGTGKPSIVIPPADPPSELVSQVLIEGSGSPIAKGQTVTMQLTGWLWATGEQFDSTWDAGTMMVLELSTERTIPGLVYGLDGRRVGSQVLLIIPPSLGLGRRDAGAIPASSTLVYVVDILDAR